AFGDAYPDASFSVNDYIRLTDGDAGVPAFREAVASLSDQYPHNQLLFSRVRDGYAAVQDALRPQVVAVWLLAGVLFMAGLLLASQAIGRQIFAQNRDLSDLRALGMTPHELGWLGVLHGWTIASSACSRARDCRPPLSPARGSRYNRAMGEPRRRCAACSPALRSPPRSSSLPCRSVRISIIWCIRRASTAGTGMSVSPTPSVRFRTRQ